MMIWSHKGYHIKPKHFFAIDSKKSLSGIIFAPND